MTKPILLLLIVLLVPGMSSAQTMQVPIIDMHLRARISLSEAPANLPCHPPPCTGAPRVSISNEDPLSLTIEAVDRYNIVLGFLSDDLDKVFKWIEAAPACERNLVGN